MVCSIVIISVREGGEGRGGEGGREVRVCVCVCVCVWASLQGDEGPVKGSGETEVRRGEGFP